MSTTTTINVYESEAAAKAAAAAADPEYARIEALVEARTAAKKARDFAEADRIRAELLGKGVTLIDTKEGTTYRIGDAT